MEYQMDDSNESIGSPKIQHKLLDRLLWSNDHRTPKAETGGSKSSYKRQVSEDTITSQRSPKYVRKKRKAAVVSADFEQYALVLEYEVHVTVVSETGEELEQRTQTKKKLIHLKDALKEHTDCAALANRIIESSELIPLNRFRQILALLNQLKAHRPAISQGTRQHPARVANPLLDGTSQCQRGREISQTKASIEDLEDYVSCFYDESGATCLWGSDMILKLCSLPRNLERLRRCMEGSLIRTLVRVTTDKYRCDNLAEGGQSIALVINLLKIFSCFGVFAEFHAMLQTERVGALALRILVHNIDRIKAVDSFRLAMTTDCSKLLGHCVKLLMYMGENTAVQGKMHRKGVTSGICMVVIASINGTVGHQLGETEACIDFELLVLSVRFLHRLSVFRESKDAILDASLGGEAKGKGNSIAAIVHILARPDAPHILHELCLKVLFNLSFDRRLVPIMFMQPDLESKPPFETLMRTLDECLRKRQSLRQLILRLLYQLSAGTVDTDTQVIGFCNAYPLKTLFHLYSTFPKSKRVPVELFAIFCNLTKLRWTAFTTPSEKLASALEGYLTEEFVGSLVDRLQHSLDDQQVAIFILKVLRNVSTGHFRRLSRSFSQQTEQSIAAAIRSEKTSKLKSGVAENECKTDPAFDRCRVRHKDIWSSQLRRLCKLISRCVQDDVNEGPIVDLLHVLANVLAILSASTPTDGGNDATSRNKVAEVLEQYHILAALSKLLLPGFAKDDVLLAVVLVLQEVGHQHRDTGWEHHSDTSGTHSIRALRDDMLHTLATALMGKRNDPELVYHLLFLFYRVLRELVRETRVQLSQKTEKKPCMPLYVPQLTGLCCDIIEECSSLETVKVCVTEPVKASQIKLILARAVLELITELEKLLMPSKELALHQLVRDRLFEMHNRAYMDLMEQDSDASYETASTVE